MSSNRLHGQVVAVVLVVVLASLFVPGAVGQETGQPEGEPNDSPLNATFVAPDTTVSGEIASDGTNASAADADWFAVPAQAGQNVTVTFESGPDSERLLVFLASPNDSLARSNGSRNVSAVDDTLADATIAPPGSTVTLTGTANDSRIYFVGVTGLSGNYEFTVETSGAMAMGQNGTNMTGAMNASNETRMANASATTTATTSTQTATSTASPTDTTTESTSAASTGGSGGDGGGSGSGDGSGNGQGTSASGPGFGLIAALVALLAAALLAARRR